MKIKGVHEKDVKTFVEKRYNFDISKINYFPIGEDAACYIVSGLNGKKFVKVYNKGKKAFKSIREIKVVLNFLYKIHKEDNFDYSPLPLKNIWGNLISRLNGRPVVVYEYLLGHNVNIFTDEDYKMLGEIMGEVHSLNKNKFEKVKDEALDLRWEKKILGIIFMLKKVNKFKALSDELLPNEKTFIDALNFLESESLEIKKRKENYVVVHSDLHGGNLMKNGKEIKVIDWDGLEFALPEKDLFWFKNSHDMKINSAFLMGYRKTRGKDFSSNPDFIKFYSVKRFLGDLVFFSRKLMNHITDSKMEKDSCKAVRDSIKRLEVALK